MNEKDLIIANIDYLKEICRFAKRTINFHKRICQWWEVFLRKKRQRSILDTEAEDLLAWIIHRQNQGIQNVTVQKEMCALRTLYQYLYDYGHIAKNPAASLPELICRPASEQQYLTVDECFAFLDAFDRSSVDGFRNYTIVALLWSTGLRSAELCALRWHDIDLEEGTLLVRKGKGGKQRLLFFNDRILEDMRKYYEKMGGKSEGPVFVAITKNQYTGGTGPGALSQSALVDMIRHHGVANGFKKKVSPKTFRHTFATHMLEAGVPLEDIKEMLGHDDETETCIYIHVTVEATKRLLVDHIGNPDKYV